MNVKSIKPIMDTSLATQKIQTRKVFAEKPDEFKKQTQSTKKDFKTKVKDFFQKAKNVLIIVGASVVSGLAVFATMMLVGSWMMNTMIEFMQTLWSNFSYFTSL